MLKNKAVYISEILMATFTMAELKDGLFNLIKQFIKQDSLSLADYNIPDEILSLNTAGRLSKKQLCFFCSLPFLSRPLFSQFREFLPDEVVTLMDTILWEGILHEEEISERFKIKIKAQSKRRYYDGNQFYLTIFPQFRIFKASGVISFYNYEIEDLQIAWPVDLRRVVSAYYPKPPEAELIGLDTIEPTAHRFENGAAAIFRETPLLLHYLKQRQIKITKRNRPVLSTIPKMKKQLGLEEFFPESDSKWLKHLRTRLIAGLLVHHKPSGKNNIDPPTFIKEILIDKVYLDNYYPSVTTILHFIKGMTNIENNYCFHIEPDIINFLRTFPKNKWVAFRNIETHNQYQFNQFLPLSPYIAHEKLYYEYDRKEEEDDFYYYGNKHYINGDLLFPGVITPYLKGVFFYFAALGLFDLAFDSPNTETLGLTYFSPYDELKYVRLTDFGIYALGLTHKYEPPITTAPYQISLSDHSLTYVLNEENETAETLFAPFSQKISSRRYKTNIPLFLKGCNSKTDLKNRVSLFQHAVQGDLPPNWVQFFKDLDQRMSPLQKVTGYEVFKIPHHQKELLHLLAVAPEFRNYTLKAADFHLLIPKKSIDQFKKDLKAYGYMMP